LSARSGVSGHCQQDSATVFPQNGIELSVGVMMSISLEEKTKIIGEFAKKEGDTGSPEVQIAVLTAEIQAISEHLQTHAKDHSGRRGLLSKVSRRRRLLDYLKGFSHEKYVAIITRLNIRK